MKLRIGAVSDLHGQLPLSIPSCDLLVIAGDICPDFDRRSPYAEHQAVWLKKEFGPWLHEHRHSFKAAVLTWGNHDYAGELLRESPEIWMPASQREYVEVCVDKMSRHGLRMGARIWCSPWSLRFMDWAWMKSEDQLEEIYRYIPESLDILVSHDPPFRHCDRNMRRDHCGSQALADRVSQLAASQASPKVLVCGHIHEGRGTSCMDYGLTTVWNVSAFKTAHPVYMVNDPVVTFDIEVGR